MDKEEIKTKIDLDNIKEFTDETGTFDYIYDSEGNAIVSVSPLEILLINRIKDLEARILKLESRG